MNPISDAAANRLRIGCGACEPACQQGNVELRDFFSEGVRPVTQSMDACSDCRDCLDVCPGIETDFRIGVEHEGSFGKANIENCGPILEIWESHASDPDILYKGYSGGVLSALAL